MISQDAMQVLNFDDSSIPDGWYTGNQKIPDHFQPVLYVLSRNLQNNFCKRELEAAATRGTEHFNHFEADRIRALQNLCIEELIYHYCYTLTLKNLVHVHPMPQPATLIYSPTEDGDDTHPVSVLTRKHESVDKMFGSINNEILEVISKISETVTVKMANLKRFLLENTDKYKCVAYNNEPIHDRGGDGFAQYYSNAAIISKMKNLNIQEFNMPIPADEAILYNDPKYSGIIWCPYMLPMRISRTNIAARYAWHIPKKASQNYLRIKIEH